MIPNVVEHVGDVVVIRRNGKDGGRFPLRNSATIGRSESCDIRIQLQYVSRKHAELSIANEKVVLTNCSSVNPIMVNGEPVDGTTVLRHMDIFSIGDRAFRFEYLKPFQSDDEVNDEDPDRTCQLDPGVLPVAMRARMSGGMHMRPPRPLTTASHGPLKSKVSAENVAANEQALVSDGPVDALKKTPVKKPQSPASNAQARQVNGDQVGIEELPANPTRRSLMSQADVDRLVDDLVEGMRTSLRLSTPIRKDIESRRFSPASRGAHVPIADKENAEPEPDDMVPPSATRARLATPVRRAIESRLQCYAPRHPSSTAATATTRTAVTATQQQQRKPLPTPIKQAIQSRRLSMPTPRSHHQQDDPQQKQEQEAEMMPTGTRDLDAEAVKPPASAPRQQSLPTPIRHEMDARRRSHLPPSAAAADPAATDYKLDAPAFTQPARRMSTRSSTPSAAAAAAASSAVSATKAAVEAMTAEPQEDEEEGRHPLEVTQRGWQRSSALPTPVRREIDARRRSYAAPRRLSVEHVQEVVEEKPVCEGEGGEEDVVDDDEPRLINRAPLPTPVKRAIHSRRRSSYAIEPALPTVNEGETEDDFNAAFTALRAMNITPAAPRTIRPRRGSASGASAVDARAGVVDSYASIPNNHDPASRRVDSTDPVGLPGASAPRTPAIPPHQARLTTPIRMAIDARRQSYAAPGTTQAAIHSRGRYGLLDEESDEDGDDGEVTLGGSHPAGVFSDVIAPQQLHAEEDEGDEREELLEEEGDNAKDSFVDQRVMTVTPAVSRDGARVAVKAQQDDGASDAAAQHVNRSVPTPLARDINSRRQSSRTRSASIAKATVRHDHAAIKAQLDEEGRDSYAEDAFGDQRGITVTPAVPVGRRSQPQAATRRRLSDDMHADGSGRDNDSARCAPVAIAVRQSLGGVETDDAFADHRDTTVTRTEPALPVTRGRPQSPRPPSEGAPARRSMTGAFVTSPVRSIQLSDDGVYEEELNNDAFIEQRDMDFTPAVAHRPRILRPRRTGHDDSDAFSEQRMMAVTPAVARAMRARDGARRASQRATRGMEGEQRPVENVYADARMMTVTPMVQRTRSRRAPQTAEDDAFSEHRHMAFTPAPVPVRRSSRRQQQQANGSGQEVDENPFFAHRGMTVTPAVPRRTTRRQQHTPAPAQGGGIVDPQVATAAVCTPAMPTRRSTGRRQQQQQLQTPSLTEQAGTAATADDDAYPDHRNMAITPAMIGRWRQQAQRGYASVKADNISESDLELPQRDTFSEHRTTDSTPAVPTRRSTRGQLGSAAHFQLQGAEALEEEEEDPYSEHLNMAFTPAVPTRRNTRSQRKAVALSKEEAEQVDEEDHVPFTEQRKMAVTPAVPVRRSNRNRHAHNAPQADGGHELNDEDDDDAFESHRALAVTPAVPAGRTNTRTAAARPRTAYSHHHTTANGDDHEDADPCLEHRAMTVTPMPRRVTRSTAAAAAPARAAAAAAASCRSGATDADDEEVIRAMANTPSEFARVRAQRPLPTPLKRSGASRRSSLGRAREQGHDNGEMYAEDDGEERDAFEEHCVMAVTPAVQRDSRPVCPRAQKPVSETVRVSDEMYAEEKGADGDLASERSSVGESEGDDDAFVEQRAMAGYTPAAPVKRPSSVGGKVDAYAEEEGEAQKPTQRRRSLLEELGESNRIEEELHSGAEEAADLRMLQAVSHAMSRDSGVETGAAFSAAMDAFLEEPPRFRQEAQPIVDQHDSDAAGGQTSIEEVERVAARDGNSTEDVQSSEASPPSEGQVSREPQTDDDDGQLTPPQQQQHKQRQDGFDGAEQGRLSTTDGNRTECNSTVESSDVMPAYVREDLMAVRDAAEALRADADGALSPSTAYDVAMERYMEDPEAFRRRMAAGNGLWSPGVDRATNAHRPSGQGHISPLTGDSSPASASPAASGESQTFMQILKYLRTVRQSPNKDHGNEQDGVSQVKPQPTRAEPNRGLPIPMRDGLAASLTAPSPPAVGSPEPRPPITGREGGDHSLPFKGALATDLRLVELYAKEMAEVGRVPADYAWTVALDTYLADRGAFRQHLGSLLADVEAPSDFNGMQLPNGSVTDEDGDHVVGDAPSPQHSEGSNVDEGEGDGAVDSRHHSDDEESEDDAEEVGLPARGATSPNTRKTRTTRGRAAASASTTTNRRAPTVNMAGGAARKAPTKPSVGSMKKSAAHRRALDRDDDDDDDKRVCAGRSPSPVVLTKRGTRRVREKGQQRDRQPQRQVQCVTQQEEDDEEELHSHAPRAPMAGPRAAASAAEASSSSSSEAEGEGGGDVLILCDGCDGEFGLNEVGLREVPDGDWYCDACRPQQTAAVKRATRKAAAAGGASDVQTERTGVRGKRATSKKDNITTTSTSARTRRATAAAAAATSSSAPSTAERPKRSNRSVARAKGH